METASPSSDTENNCPPGDSSSPVGPEWKSTNCVTPSTTSTTRQQESKATSSRSKDSRLPTARTGSVFERLYKTQTVCTEIRRSSLSPATGINHGRGSHVAPMNRTKRHPRSPVFSVDESAKTFERLCITSTPTRGTSLTRNHPRSTSKTFRSPTRNIPSTKSPLLVKPKAARVGYVYSPRIKPLTVLYFDSRYHPGIGREVIDPITLGSSFFQVFCEYENGGLTTAQIAREIIIAFFKKDFPSGRHWELHEPTVEDRPGPGISYHVKMCATYDWQDAFRIASAQGVVQCNPDAKEVSVMNYMYDVTSDL